MLYDGKQRSIFTDGSKLHKLLIYGSGICAVVIAVFVLFCRPMPGVADQGDFQRVMGVTGLNEINDKSKTWFKYVITQYGMSPLNKYRLLGKKATTSMIYPIAAARGLSSFTAGRYFSTKNLAVIYTAFYILSLFIGIKYLKFKRAATGIFFTLCCLVILMDGNYLIWFNSLYGEPMMITSLLLFIAGVLYAVHKINRVNIIDMMLLFVSAYLFLGAKLQCFSALPLIAILVIRIALLSSIRLSVRRVLNVSAAVIMIFMLSSYVKGIYSDINGSCGADTMYNSVFYGILKQSDDPKKDLEALGLSKDMAGEAGKHAYLSEEQYEKYAPSYSITKLEFNDKMSNFKLLKFYLSNPKRLLKGMEYTASKCFNTMGSLGKYEKDEVEEYTYSFDRFTIWSDIRSNLIPKSLLFIVPFYLSVFVITIMEHKKNKHNKAIRLRIELLWTIMTIGLLQFPMPFIGNGEADTAKQLFLFNYTFDMVFLCAAVWCFDRVILYIKGQNKKCADFK